MFVKIVKWGNSLGIRIPKSFAIETDIEEGSHVEITMEGESIVIKPVKPPKYTLSGLVSMVREDNIHEEISTGDAIGRAIW
ncbi:MAG TPA: AbrB/MazE/SpoVT family DNA-binding domain-containing protein [Candidatus Krumholzibacterium sp.]|nr:AbrB/MazE/SpoVT family DNA-binding domain-containing protein [Candidatus Krumholzibacterium sp.]